MAAHPLDPLTAQEIVSTAAICRQYVAEKGLGDIRFNTITLKVFQQHMRLICR
jgi:Cu2+-containing amine oxidase